MVEEFLTEHPGRRVAGVRRPGIPSEVAAVARQRQEHVGAGEVEPVDGVAHGQLLGGRAAEELPAGWDVEEEVGDGDRRPHRASGRCQRVRPSLRRPSPWPPSADPATRDTIVRWETAPTAASASPRNPRVATVSRPSGPRACSSRTARRRGEARRAGSPTRRPGPRSTRTLRRTRATSTSVAPASREFSTSSFTTDAGRSTTSPAAIRWTTSGASRRIGPRVRGALTPDLAAAGRAASAGRGARRAPRPGSSGRGRARRSASVSGSVGEAAGSAGRSMAWVYRVGALRRAAPPSSTPSDSSFFEQPLRLVDQLRREPGELRHVDPVAPVGASRDEAVEEHDPVRTLLDGEVGVRCRGELLDQLRELVIVGREQGPAP